MLLHYDLDAEVASAFNKPLRDVGGWYHSVRGLQSTGSPTGQSHSFDEGILIMAESTLRVGYVIRVLLGWLNAGPIKFRSTLQGRVFNYRKSMPPSVVTSESCASSRRHMSRDT